VQQHLPLAYEGVERDFLDQRVLKLERLAVLLRSPIH
jgi:hypothetical protein